MLRGLSLSVSSGEIVVVAGPNGAGKTTLLRTLACLLPRRGGTVTLDGRDAGTVPRREWARSVAFASQNEDGSWPLTVEDSVLLGRAPHRGWLTPFARADREAAAFAIERMGLAAFRERTLPTLSGGERRRAILARVLAQSPSVLLLDEPTAFLDLHYQSELSGALHKLAKQEGMAILAAIHDLTLAAMLADRIYLLSEGRLIAEGKPTEVLTVATLSRAYGTSVLVTTHPELGTPVVLPVLPR